MNSADVKDVKALLNNFRNDQDHQVEPPMKPVDHSDKSSEPPAVANAAQPANDPIVPPRTKKTVRAADQKPAKSASNTSFQSAKKPTSKKKADKIDVGEVNVDVDQDGSSIADAVKEALTSIMPNANIGTLNMNFPNAKNLINNIATYVLLLTGVYRYF